MLTGRYWPLISDLLNCPSALRLPIVDEEGSIRFTEGNCLLVHFFWIDKTFKKSYNVFFSYI